MLVDRSSRPDPKPSASTSFCTTRPLGDEVVCTLRALGFQLTFQMGDVTFAASSRLPPLPAQYHFKDQYDTEVIYLAGCDAEMDGVQAFPPHKSRFWIYCGVDPAAYQRTLSTLAARWSLLWQAA